MSVKGPLLATATKSIPSADRREYHARKCDFRNPQANRTKPEGMVRMSWCEELCLALTKPMGEQGGQTRNRSCQRLSELFPAHGCYRRPHGPRGTQRSGIVRAARTEAEEFWTADLRVKVCWLKRVPGQPGECPAAQSQGARICPLINRHAVRAHAFISRTLFTRKSRNTFIWWGSKREKLFLHLGIFEKLLPRGILLVGK